MVDRRRRTTRAAAAAAAAVGLVVAACGTDDAEGPSTSPEPAPTVTVTRTATPAPDAGPAAAPSPGTATAADVCAGAGLGDHAFIFVTSPQPGATLTSGDTVEGCSNTFEAAYQYQLLDRDGAVLDEGSGTASCGTGCVGDWSFDVDFSVDEEQVGTLRVFTESARDGSETDVNAIPVILQP